MGSYMLVGFITQFNNYIHGYKIFLDIKSICILVMIPQTTAPVPIPLTLPGLEMTDSEGNTVTGMSSCLNRFQFDFFYK